MELEKIGQSVKESFLADGSVEKEIESVDFNVKDGEDVVGTVVVYKTYASISFNINGTSSVDDGMARVEEFFRKN